MLTLHLNIESNSFHKHAKVLSNFIFVAATLEHMLVASSLHLRMFDRFEGMGGDIVAYYGMCR